MTQLWRQLKEALRDFLDDKAPRLAAALAYHTVFSLAPTLIIVIAVAGLVWEKSAVQDAVVSQFSGLVGAKGGELVKSMIAHVSQPASSRTALVIGSVTLLFGAIGTFAQLKDALNTVWEVKAESLKG